MRWITAHYFHASNLDPTMETEKRERERERERESEKRKGGKNQKKKQMNPLVLLRVFLIIIEVGA
jgi:hypothetical protein